ncbi:MAG: helix-turn-helix transcriptional regulator [Flavobacteriales bacterium]|nr:helix-turn-helix transcriptional regulator [Flavobacteriales bacterium]
MAKLNRIKEVLIEQKRTGKWLAENLGKDMATVSRWCNNHTQPSIENLDRIASLLDVDIRKLLHKTK